MRTRPALSLGIVLICLLFTQNRSLSQTPTSPQVTVKNFYEWYLHSLNQNEDPLNKERPEMGKFVTRRLMASLERALKRPDGIDADFFIDAQDWDEAWEKNIDVSQLSATKSQVVVKVVLKGGPSFGNHPLRVTLRKEDGLWKIDGVNGRRNP
jgi:hypothetical protein